MTSKSFKVKLKENFKAFKSNLIRKFTVLYFFILALVSLLLLIELLYIFYGFDTIQWIKSLPYVYPFFSYIVTQIAKQSVEGIYYLFTFSSLFFLPVPLEIIILKLISDGFTGNTFFLTIFVGLLTGQHINYFLGRFLGFFIRPFIRKKTKVWIENKLQKRGMLVIFLINLAPLPYPLFNFVVGLSKYPYKKWLLVVSAAFFVKLAALNWIFFQFF